ncbi:hypothetical protein EMPS_06744 [Entomortierella parvispora]|uniref:Xylanolytic transcriptional activator regulatory domain-containing protein n=1 Tax=Entomortierella parvispora TaxID=205924 RepID=A0A9P3HD29_9FUNG|nr:hypothetical protein EMPS_06744 [Entomortierella parvispora]
MATVDEESYSQNTNADTNGPKPGLKRKQPEIIYTPADSTASSPSASAAASTPRARAGAGTFVYQQPKSLQHHPLPSQPIQFDLTSSRSETIRQEESANPIDNSFLNYPISSNSKAVNVVDRSSAEDLERIASVLTEATLNNIAYYGPSAAMVTGTFNDEDLWGAQLGAASTDGDVLVPEEMQILPDESTRQFLVSLYYKNHYRFLPMLQRQVIRVCEENIHIPHCLLLCNAVYYCGSMFSTNLTLRKDVNDESTLGEDFFSRGQALLEKKFLTTHICTVQALLFFAIGHKSPAQRSAFISQAITMALDMGLHTRLDDTVNSFMRSYRARIFWCCYLFDSSASAINGKPALISDEEISVDMIEAGDLGPENETYSDRYFVHVLHGWQICRKIRKNSKLMVRQPPPSQAFLLQNLARLDNELVDWQQHLPKVFEFFPTEGSMVSELSSQCASTQLLCYALIILLHHPYLPNPKSPEAFKPPPPGSMLPDSQGYCTQAAKEITKIGGILLKEAPKTYEQSTPTRYALNFAIRIHLRNSKCTINPTLAKESRRDLQKTMDYIERVENLQFFRVNRAKKSDVADLLASCRAALAQQKSGLDLAKEAAALKHRQFLLEKQAILEKQRQDQALARAQQEQMEKNKQQQQQQQQQNIHQPVLASQALHAAGDMSMDTSETQPSETPMSPKQILLSMQSTQQHPNIRQQTYQQQQLHLQMYTQERTQHELAHLNRLQRQGQLDVDHQQHQHFQQLAMAKHKQQIFMQQQQQHQHLHQHLHQHHQQPHQHQHQHLQSNYQSHGQRSMQSSLNQYPNMSSTTPNRYPQTTAPYTALSEPFQSHSLASSQVFIPTTDFQDPSAFARLTPEQQQQLFIAFSHSLSSHHQASPFSPNQPTLQQTDGGHGENGMGGAGIASLNMDSDPTLMDFSRAHLQDIRPNFTNASMDRGDESTTMSSSFFNNGNPVGNIFSSSPSHPRTVSTSSSSMDFSASPQQQHQQQHQRTGSRVQGSPESVTEESILQSWSISTPFDQIYLNPNLAPDDPRNDLGTFTYLPSEFEYGDAPALSPTSSSISGGTAG